MKDDLNNLMGQISKLPQDAKKKIFNMLLYQNSNASEKDIELIESVISSNERLKKWLERTDSLIEKTDSLIDDIRKSA